MSKKNIILLIILSTLLLSSCSLRGSRTYLLNKANDDEKAENRLEEVIECINANFE